MSTSDDYKNYVQLFNRGTMLKPRHYQLTAIHHQATVHKKTLVIMAVMQSFALRPFPVSDQTTVSVRFRTQKRHSNTRDKCQLCGVLLTVVFGRSKFISGCLHTRSENSAANAIINDANSMDKLNSKNLMPSETARAYLSSSLSSTFIQNK
jgi:hypothetical protein